MLEHCQGKQNCFLLSLHGTFLEQLIKMRHHQSAKIFRKIKNGYRCTKPQLLQQLSKSMQKEKQGTEG